MLSSLSIRLRSLFHRARVELELDDELRFHMDQQAEKYMHAGMSREEALRCVRLEFGGIEQVREDCRDALGVSFPESLAQDLRYASPGHDLPLGRVWRCAIRAIELVAPTQFPLLRGRVRWRDHSSRHQQVHCHDHGQDAVHRCP